MYNSAFDLVARLPLKRRHRRDGRRIRYVVGRVATSATRANRENMLIQSVPLATRGILICWVSHKYISLMIVLFCSGYRCFYERWKFYKRAFPPYILLFLFYLYMGHCAILITEERIFDVEWLKYLCCRRD